MHYLLTEPVILDDSDLRRLIGPVARTPYAEGIRKTLAPPGARQAPPETAGSTAGASH